jgi:hypothetical protein
VADWNGYPSVGLSWTGGSQRTIDLECRAQNDPKERARRLLAYKERCLAATIDGTTAMPLGEGFTSARLVDVRE